MKLSEMTTKQAEDALCEIVDPIERLMDDEELLESAAAIDRAMPNASMAVKKTKWAMKLVPLLLRKHRDDTYAVVRAMTGKTQQELESEKLMDFISDVAGFVDKEFLDFLAQYGVTIEIG